MVLYILPSPLIVHNFRCYLNNFLFKTMLCLRLFVVNVDER